MPVDHITPTGVGPKYGHPLTDRLVTLVGSLKDLRLKIVTQVIEAEADVRNGQYAMSTLVDVAYLTYHTNKLTEEIGKELRRLSTICQQASVVKWAHENVGNMEPPEAVDGFIARGTPREGMGANVPRPGDPMYVALLKEFGATDDMIERDVVRPHWPSLCAEIDRRNSQGLPLPPGLTAEASYPRYYLDKLRLRKGVNIDVGQSELRKQLLKEKDKSDGKDTPL